MTLANKITIGRMITVPFVLWALYQAYYVLAFSIFAVASVSDGVDGYIARKYGQQTVLGSILDPLADKSLLTLTFIVLTASPNTLVAFPAWLTVAVTYRDLLIMLGSGMAKWFCPMMQFRPIVASKMTTFFQIATVLVVCLANLLASFSITISWLKAPIHVLSVITGLCCLVSVLGYYRTGMWLLQTEGEEPTRNQMA
jgi:cardiolipin synthase